MIKWATAIDWLADSNGGITLLHPTKSVEGYGDEL